MFCTETEYCHFVVWSPRRTKVLIMSRNDDFLFQALTKAEEFHKSIIVPELLARYYTTIKETASQPICFCNEIIAGSQLIQCSNNLCLVKLFHVECVIFRSEEDGPWTCDYCTTLLENIGSVKF